jgi:hypothetical protein
MTHEREDVMSEVYQSLSHSKWDCKYHVVFVPKRRRKTILGQTRRELGAIFHALARQKECQIIEGHLVPDHVHMCIAIPPKHPVASVGIPAGLRWRTVPEHGLAGPCGDPSVAWIPSQ